MCDEITAPDHYWACPPECESRLIDLERIPDGLRTISDAVPAMRDRTSGASTHVDKRCEAGAPPSPGAGL